MQKLTARFERLPVIRHRCDLLILKNLRPLGSVVEHSLHTRGVTSSNLVAGTNIFQNLRATPSDLGVARFVLHTLSHPVPMFFHAEGVKFNSNAHGLESPAIPIL